MAKIAVEFAGFDAVLKKLAKLEADTKAITEEALQKSFDIVTAKAEAAIQPANLPAGGKYSRAHGGSADSLLRKMEVTWTGTEASTPVGFDLKHGGMPTVYMSRGTPRMRKVQQLYDAFFSDAVKAEIITAQKEVFYQALEKLENG